MVPSKASYLSLKPQAVALVAVVWTLLVAGSLGSVLWSHRGRTTELARIEAEAGLARDLAFVRWAGSHGGVYVAATSQSPPDPRLANVPERDITAPSGRQLTLLNSACMLRQMHEFNAPSAGTKVRLTSLQVLRPENAPDAWETHALQALQDGPADGQISEVVPVDGRPHLRLLRPLRVERQCLKCHAEQGYRVGDIRGGISAAVDLTPHARTEATLTWPLAMTHIGIWLLGLLGIAFGTRQIRTRWEERLSAEAEVRLNEARLEALLQLNQKSGGTLDELADFALEESVRLTGSQIGYVAFASDDEQVLTMHAWSESAMRQCEMREKPRTYLVAETGLWGEAVRQRRPVITNEYAGPHPGKKGLPEGHVPLVRHMNVPIFDGQRIVVVAGVGNKSFNYDDSDVRQVTLLMSELWRIVQRQRAESSLRRSEEMLSSIFRAAPVGIGVVANRVLVHVNDSVCRMVGYAREELLGRDSRILYPSDAEYEFVGHEKYLQIAQSGIGTVETRWQRKDGGVLDVLLSSTLLDPADPSKGATFTALDISARKQAEEALRRSAALHRSLIEHLPQRIIVKDRDSVFVSCNANFAREHGLPPEQVVGLDDFAFYGRELAEKYRADDQAVIAAGTAREIEELNQVNGHERWVHVHKVPYCDEAGRIVGVVGIFEDITGRKQAEQEIRSLNESLEQRVRERTAELEASNRELEAFTYSVSHDLRAPLRAIHGFARILTDEYRPQLDDQARRLLDVVCSEAQRMGHLIDDLLNFCRLGRCAIQPACVDMERMVREVYCEVLPGTDDRQVNLRLHALPCATADPALVRQVWVNLLDNALKYTRHRATAELEIGGAAVNGEHVYFVRDNGIGLDMKYAHKLFKVFQRLHGQDEFEGNGVGLALVQRIVHMHDGRVWLDAEPDRGATFFFTLPRNGHEEAL